MSWPKGKPRRGYIRLDGQLHRENQFGPAKSKDQLDHTVASIISSSTVGAVGELRVAADLLTKGFEVFRALSPTCSCDLLAMKDGRIIRIECRTNTAGNLQRADVVAIVSDMGIRYVKPKEVPSRQPIKLVVDTLTGGKTER